MQVVYLICFLFSIGMLLWLKVFDVRRSINQFINLLIIVVSNLGYLFLSMTTNLADAIDAKKIACVGGVFMPVFYFFLVLELCHIEINRFVSIIMVTLQAMLFSIVCVVDRNELFYKSISIRSVNGVTVLDVVNGPLHILYPIMMFFYTFASIFAIVYAFKKKKPVDPRGANALVFFLILGVCAYIIENAVHFEYEIIPIVYDVLMLGALIPIYDSNLFTVYENDKIIKEQLGKVGFLAFDTGRIYKGCNECMTSIFPELSEYRVGQKIENCSKQLMSVIDQIEELKVLYKKKPREKNLQVKLTPFSLNNEHYAGTIYAVKNTLGILRGYTIEISNDTDQYTIITMNEKYNEKLSNDVQMKTKQIQSIQEKVILGMAQIVESRDLSTGGHIKRTSDIVKIFADKLIAEDVGIDKRFLDLVIRSAPMHDLGKIGIDDAILRKKEGLTDEDFTTMKTHAEIGYNMVKEILSGVEEPDFVSVAENVAHYHHEKMNGKGYPDGLKGEEIPLEARIMALADVFDALVSKRCYKEGLSCDEALDIIKKDAGTHFDEKLAMLFISCKPELENYLEGITQTE